MKTTTTIVERKKNFDVNQETRNATIVEVSENPYYEGVRMSQVISIQKCHKYWTYTPSLVK